MVVQLRLRLIDLCSGARNLLCRGQKRAFSGVAFSAGDVRAKRLGALQRILCPRLGNQRCIQPCHRLPQDCLLACSIDTGKQVALLHAVALSQRKIA
jgi:hypothetical protein